MTLAQFAMIFWHNLAAPILAGIITAVIVSWVSVNGAPY